MHGSSTRSVPARHPRHRPDLCVLVGGVALMAAGLAYPQDAPRTLLHMPFNGTADAAVAAGGYGTSSYALSRDTPGKQGEAAEIGSLHFPCSLMLPARGLWNARAGSLELWFRPNWDAAAPASRRLRRVFVSDDRQPAEAGHFALAGGGGGIGFDLRTTERLNVGAVADGWQAGEWHHIIVTWDSAVGLRLFLDGKPAAERKATWDAAALGNPRRLHIGGEWNGKYLVDGALDELRVYDRALTPEQAQSAFAGTLAASPAPTPAPDAATAPPPATPRKPPQVLFYAPFDGSPTATAAGGKAEPLTATGCQFAPGLSGQALRATAGILLSYAAAGNVRKDRGAISLWVAATKAGLNASAIYFADEFNSYLNPAQVINALWLWFLKSGPTDGTIRFDIRPPLVSAGARNWEPDAWHHLAGCWENGEEVRLYIDGRPMVKQRGKVAIHSGATWTPVDPKVFYIGSYNRQYPANALIDEVKVFNAPLSDEEVAAEAARFVLPLTLDLGRTLFERTSGDRLPLRYYNATSQAVAGRYEVEITDPTEATVLSATVSVTAPARGWGEASLGVPNAALAREGVYRVHCRPAGRVAPALSSYFLVVPPIARQRPTDGVADPAAELKLVDRVDCSAESGPERFTSTGKSAVVPSPLGAYREAGPTRGDRIAYRLRLQTPGAWHVAVVTYPDDKPRSCDIVANSPHHTGNTYDVATGYFCGDDCRLSGKLVQLPIYFTAREEDLAFEFMTLETGRPAAVARIEVYETGAGLPAAAMRVPADGGRHIGNYWEDPTICLEHGGLDFSAPEVYKSFARLIDYLRFSGQDLICYPIAWYLGTMYPSAREGFRMGAGDGRHTIDWVEYALRLCERRGVRFLPEMYFAGTLTLRDEWAGQTEAEVWAGADSPKLVTWDGTLSRGFYFNPPYYNVLHPVTQQALVDYVEEAADRYSQHPSLEGLSLIVGQGNCVWFGSIQSGYDDYLVGRFERETGLRVPADKTGPARFSQRYRWLTANAYERWVGWRCEKIHDLYVDLAARLRRRRPDLKLYLTYYAVDGNNVNPLYNLDAWRPGGRSTEQLYREGGFDMKLYEHDAGIVLRRVMYPIDYPFFRIHGGGAGPIAHEILARDIDLLSEGIAPFKHSAEPATAFHLRYFESAIGKDQPIPGFWWQCHPWRVSQPTASGRNFLEYYAHAVAELDAASLAYGGYTVTSMGHEDELRDFARYYRALPRVRFTDVPGMADPVCMREWQGEAKRYLYLVNRMPYAVTAHVAFGARTDLEDLATGIATELPLVTGRMLPAALPLGSSSEHDLPDTPAAGTVSPREQRVTGHLLELTLPAYALRSYLVTPATVERVYASAAIPAGEAAGLRERLEAARKTVSEAKCTDAERTEARATLVLVERALARGEASRAGYLLDSFPLARLRR